jgi:hypothetical protein
MPRGRAGNGSYLLIMTVIAVSILAAGFERADANPIALFDGDLFIGRSPKNMTVEPAHQYTYTGTVFHYSTGEPWAGMPAEQVWIRFADVPFDIHPDGPADAAGHVVWGPDKLHLDGEAMQGPQIVTIHMEIMGYPEEVWWLDEIRSPENSGDGLVALSDLVNWQMAFVQQSPRHVGDLDCDLAIALSDLVRWQRHFMAY